MRIIGLDIHRAFAEAVAWDDGKLKRLGRVDMRRPLLEAFAKKLLKDDVVVVEATGNASSVAAVIANPKQVRIIAHAKIKTDTLDAGVLAGGRGRQTLDDNSGRRHGGGAHHLGGDRRG
jgi:transposase